MLRIQIADKKGFTLVELMVAVSIIALLSVIGMTVYSSAIKQARNARKVEDVQALGKAYEANYNSLSGRYQRLQDTQFASGHIPYPPQGGNYSFVSGPDSTNAAICNEVKICSPLNDTTPLCIDSSVNCYCYSGQRGANNCLSTLGPVGQSPTIPVVVPSPPP